MKLHIVIVEYIKKGNFAGGKVAQLENYWDKIGASCSDWLSDQFSLDQFKIHLIDLDQ